MSEPEARGAGWTEERAERGTSEHVTGEARDSSAPMAERGALKSRDLVELVRAPAALTVPGDVLAGAAAAGWPFGRATAALAASSACLYWAGMALNDYADREVDEVERPGRPIPSGRVTPRFALGLAAGLTAAGVGLAGLAGGRRALGVTGPLAATVWAYDLVLKQTRAGPAAMAAARGLDVLVGAGAGRLRPAVPAAALVASHTLAVTVLSRREVSGADPRLPRATLAATGLIGAATGLIGIVTGSTGLASGSTGMASGSTGMASGSTGMASGRTGMASGRMGAATAYTGRGSRRRAGRLLGAGLLAVYGATFGKAQLDAVRDPAPARMQRAVGAGILGLMPLQAALAAGAGAPVAAVPVAAAFPLARRLSRRVSPT
jgi:4-hydroxybenzoate polyprenyltransferase